MADGGRKRKFEEDEDDYTNKHYSHDAKRFKREEHSVAENRNLIHQYSNNSLGNVFDAGASDSNGINGWNGHVSNHSNGNGRVKATSNGIRNINTAIFHTNNYEPVEEPVYKKTMAPEPVTNTSFNQEPVAIIRKKRKPIAEQIDDEEEDEEDEDEDEEDEDEEETAKMDSNNETSESENENERCKELKANLKEKDEIIMEKEKQLGEMRTIIESQKVKMNENNRKLEKLEQDYENKKKKKEEEEKEEEDEEEGN